jgi:activator of 2-hydroxyglutaryl-CoA dehydratase
LLTMGIDSGSAMTKAVLFDGQEIVDFRMEPSGSTPGRVIHRLYEELRTPDTAFVVATGYGRALLPEADKSITEITCHGAGAAFLCPGCDTVIDIGGQDPAGSLRRTGEGLPDE